VNPRTNHGEMERSERGVALILTILLLLIVSAIGVSSLNRAGDEVQVGATSRRQLRNVAAAEAALKLVGQQLLTAQTATAAENPIVENFSPEMGLNTRVRTGFIGDGGAPAKVELVGVSGQQLIVGQPGQGRRIYRVTVVAEDPSGGNVQLQAQFSVRSTF
jgi:Tfp pilus assembly protein PilX